MSGRKKALRENINKGVLQPVQPLPGAPIMNEKELKRLYKIYAKRRSTIYEAQKKEGLVYGGPIRRTSFEDFNANFIGAYNKLADKGIVASASQTINEMIDNEIFTGSKAEAKRDAKTLDINPEVVRAYGGLLKNAEDLAGFDLMQVPEQYRGDVSKLIAHREAISQTNEMLKAQGYTGAERAKIIGHLHYGSPE